MTLSASDTQGFEFAGFVEDSEVLYIPGAAGTTYTKGDLVGMTAGELSAAGGDTAPIGVVMETVACSANTVAFPSPLSFQPGKADDADLTLVPVRPILPAGTPRYKVSVANHVDETVVSYTPSTRAIECTTGFAADDRPNGALLYVYEGPGAGEANIVEDYDHTGGAAELLLSCTRPFNATLTTASKFIVLGSDGGASALFQLGRADSVSTSSMKIDVDDGSDDGDFVLFFSWEKVGELLGDLSVIVVPAKALVI